MDISNSLAASGIQLEAEALRVFGAAVQGAGNSLSTIGLRPQSSGSQMPAEQTVTGDWNPTPYASAIASSAGGFDPKTKFLFKVKFEFHSQLSDAIAALGLDALGLTRDLTFTVKNIDLPKVDYEYEEVNMYNFRTKVLKRINWTDLAVSFYDDTANRSLGFFNLYMMLLKPISRSVPTKDVRLEDFGFEFDSTYTALDTSYRAALPQNRKEILSKMTIEQFYINRAGQVIDAVRMNSFVFSNPRMLHMGLTELDHAMGSEPGMVTGRFDFDSVHIDVGSDAKSHVTPSLPGADLLDGVEDKSYSNIKSQEGRSRDRFAPLIARQGDRSSADLTTASTLSAGGAADIGEISGALEMRTRQTVKQVNYGVSQGTAKPTVNYVTDSAVAANEIPNLSSRTTSRDQ